MPHPSDIPSKPVTLYPASQYSLDQLTGIYNQSRADYMIPMQMSAAHLLEYGRIYDVALAHSLVAVQDGELLGVAMLGIRYARAWITRLGVIPTTRRSGVGKALVLGLLEQVDSLGIEFTMLEVIKSNIPAHQLFLSLGFKEVGELLVLKRPASIVHPAFYINNIQHLDNNEVLKLVEQERDTQPWTNQSETLRNLQNYGCFRLNLDDGTKGWFFYQCGDKFLSHFAFKTEQGNPESLARSALWYLHNLHPHLDAQVENIKATDPHLPAFFQMGYTESFRRIEMWRGAPLPGYIPQRA